MRQYIVSANTPFLLSSGVVCSDLILILDTGKVQTTSNGNNSNCSFADKIKRSILKS